MVGQDSVLYPTEDEVPKLGSIETISNNKGLREYALMSVDVPLLPTYCHTGSTAICLDTGDIYMFHKKNGWFKL